MIISKHWLIVGFVVVFNYLLISSKHCSDELLAENFLNFSFGLRIVS
jgi:hypothetical protein